jgi:hypothetical protein
MTSEICSLQNECISEAIKCLADVFFCRRETVMCMQYNYVLCVFVNQFQVYVQNF